MSVQICALPKKKSKPDDGWRLSEAIIIKYYYNYSPLKLVEVPEEGKKFIFRTIIYILKLVDSDTFAFCTFSYKLLKNVTWVRRMLMSNWVQKMFGHRRGSLIVWLYTRRTMSKRNKWHPGYFFISRAFDWLSNSRSVLHVTNISSSSIKIFFILFPSVIWNFYTFWLNARWQCIFKLSSCA